MKKFAQRAINNFREFEESERKQPSFHAHVHLVNGTVTILQLSDVQHSKLLRKHPDTLSVLKELLDKRAIRRSDILYIHIETGDVDDSGNPIEKIVYFQHIVRTAVRPVVQQPVREQPATPQEASVNFRWLCRTHVYPNSEYVRIEYYTPLPSDWLKRRNMKNRQGFACVTQNRRPDFETSEFANEKTGNIITMCTSFFT